MNPCPASSTSICHNSPQRSQLLDAYKKAKGDWSEYETKFLALMAERKVEQTVERGAIDGGCLLCSEPAPEHCHRRLVAEYFQQKWPGVDVEHIP